MGVVGCATVVSVVVKTVVIAPPRDQRSAQPPTSQAPTRPAGTVCDMGGRARLVESSGASAGSGGLALLRSFRDRWNAQRRARCASRRRGRQLPLTTTALLIPDSAGDKLGNEGDAATDRCPVQRFSEHPDVDCTHVVPNRGARGRRAQPSGPPSGAGCRISGAGRGGGGACVTLTTVVSMLLMI